jgi:hypothetical protein
MTDSNYSRLGKYMIWRKRQMKLRHIVENYALPSDKREKVLTLINKQKEMIKTIFA